MVVRKARKTTRKTTRKAPARKRRQAGKGLSSAVKPRGKPAIRRRPVKSKLFQTTVPRGYMFVETQAGSGLFSLLKKGLKKGAKAFAGKEGRALVKSGLAFAGKHGPKSIRGKANTASTILDQIGYSAIRGHPRVITAMPSGCCAVRQSGTSLWSFVKKIGKGIGKALSSKAGKAVIKGGLDLASQYGSPRVKAGAMTAQGVLDQAGYNAVLAIPMNRPLDSLYPPVRRRVIPL